MARTIRTPSFRGKTAVVLHRPHADRDNVTRQMERLGMNVTCIWPELSPDHQNVDIVLFDADMGHEEQFPWPAEQRPMPMVALIGTEAPGRVDWAIRRGAGAHLSKPIGSIGVYGALVVAVRAFEEHLGYRLRIDELEQRLAHRPQVAKAILFLMELHSCEAEEAYRRLRDLAMTGRVTIEAAAEALVAQTGGDRGKRLEG